jgi:Flp pilus assembly protein TadD
MPSLQETLTHALQRYQAGDLVGAEEGLRQVVGADPRHAAAWCCLGVVCWSQGKLQEAIDSCRQALALQPDMPEAHCNLGNALLSQGNLEQAVGCYQRALQLRPDFIDAHCNLGVALREQGKLDQAATTLRQAIGLKPTHAEAHSALASVLTALGKWDEAGWKPPASAPAVGHMPAQATGNFTFGSTHNLAKLNAAVFELWSPRGRSVLLPSWRLTEWTALARCADPLAAV